jgi:hypothetical protein
VESLEAELAAKHAATAPSPNGAESPAGPAVSAASPAPEPEPIDLLALAGADRLKKYAPVAAAVLAVLVLIWVLRRRS